MIRPAMERIGHGWMVGGLDVFQEHQATRIVSDALGTINDRLAQSVGVNCPLALGAAPEGDPFQLPLALGELVVREVGWDVHNLGPNLPARSLAGAITGYRPRLVFLSISYIVDEARFVREYQGVLEAARSVGAAIMLGGRALGPGLRVQTVCAGFGDRMSHLSEFARRLVPRPDARSGVQDVHDSAHPNPLDASGDDPGSQQP